MEDKKTSRNEQLHQAVIELFIANTPKERERVIAEYPILKTPAAITYVNVIVKYFDSDVTVVEGLPQQWENILEFITSKQEKKKIHETD